MRGRSFIPLVGWGPGRAIVSHGLGGSELPWSGYPCVAVSDAPIAVVALSSTLGEGRLEVTDELATTDVEVAAERPYLVELADEPAYAVDLEAETCERRPC